MLQTTHNKLTALAHRAWQPDWRPGIIVMGILLVVYVITLQPFVSSSTEIYTQDVAETQIVLNIGGTLHSTGYPLYVLTGIPFVWLFKLAGIAPATAPAAVSLLWSLLTLALLYELLVAMSRQPVIAASSILVLGLTESYWIHTVIPEVYTLFLLFFILILRTVLRNPDRQWKRKDWLQLALLLGFGIAHHRAIGFLVPALALYLWPQFWRMRREMPRVLATGTLLFFSGFVPYIYLPLAARLEGLWVHGNPSTIDGFMSEFLGREAAFLWMPPTSLGDLVGHATYIANILGRVLTWPVFLISAACLVWLAIKRDTRRLLFPIALTYLAFTIWVPEVIPPKILLLPVQVILGMALCEGIAWLIERLPERKYLVAVTGATLVFLAAWTGWQSYPTIQTRTLNRTGLDFIAHVATLQPDSNGRDTVLMIPAGWRHDVTGYGLYVSKTIGGFELVDHKADFAAILQRGDRLLVTPETLYAHPRDWWIEITGLPINLRSGGPGFVEISPEPLASPPAGDALDLGNGVQLLAYEVTQRSEGDFVLTLYWSAAEPPGENFSVFVHLLGSDPNLILAQADSYAPVEGFYPVTDWQPGEVVRDAYRVVAPDGTSGPLYLRAGMYRQLDDGTFENFEALTVALP